MKTLILIVFLIGALGVQAQEKQSLKDLLYGGKLKKDSTGVIRSTDDLSKKIDTSTKKEAQAQPVKTSEPTTTAQPDKNTVTPKPDIDPNIPAAAGVATATTATVAAPANVAPVKTNTKLWKEYTDSLTKILQDEILKSKQIKKNTYYLMVDYEIETDGQVTFTNVTSTPENAFLQAQVKQIMDSTPFRLNPVTDSNNQAKKVKRKQQFVITKE
jgi:hypothetical protein